MIISCYNCNKKFEIDSSLIPEKGRLVQCNSCDHKWFFVKEIINKTFTPVKNPKLEEVMETFKEDIEPVENETSETMDFLEKPTKDKPVIEKKLIKAKTKDNDDVNEDKNLKKETSKVKNNYNILGLTVIFITSIVALIILLDTFKGPIGKIFPNIDFLLYSLYETIYDIVLFFNDLI